MVVVVGSALLAAELTVAFEIVDTRWEMWQPCTIAVTFEKL
jgi:hypothetical protein